MEFLRTILVPVDFSEASMAGLAAAMRLPFRAGTSIVLVHVLDAAHLHYAVELGYGVPAQVESKARAHADQRMHRLTDFDAPEGVDVQRIICTGTPAAEILRLARELAADLLVVGRGPVPSGAALGFSQLGVVAERLLMAAPCPVLLVPAANGEPAVMPEEAGQGTDAPSGAPSTL